MNGGAVKCAGTTAQIAAVGQQNTYTAGDTNSRLNPGVEEPFCEPKNAWIGDRSSIKERTQLHAKEWTVVNGLIEFGIQQQLAPAERRRAFAAIAESGLHRIVLVFCGINMLPVTAFDTLADLRGRLAFARLFVGIQRLSHAHVAH